MASAKSYTVARTITAVAAVAIPATDPNLVALGGQVDALYVAVPITRLRFDSRGANASLVYDYAIAAKDGRLWTQVITFASASDANPKMTFSVPVGWTLAEFTPQRAIRDTLIAMFVSQQVTSVRVDYA